MRSLLLENTQDACVSPPPPPNQPKKSLCSLLIAASPPKKLLADSFTPSLTKAAGRTEEVRYGWVEGGEKKDRKEGGGGGQKKGGEVQSHRLDVENLYLPGKRCQPRLKHRLRCGERCGALLQLLLCFLCIRLINPHRFKHTSPTQSHTSLLPHYPRCDPLPLPAFLCRCNLLWLMEHTKNAFLA